jgi:hypothetical protein
LLYCALRHVSTVQISHLQEDVGYTTRNIKREREKACLTVLKVKVKVTLEQATKSQRGSRGISLLFL